MGNYLSWALFKPISGLTLTSDILERESSLMASALPRCVSALRTLPVASTRLSTCASLSLQRICSHARSTQLTADRADFRRFCNRKIEPFCRIGGFER